MGVRRDGRSGVGDEQAAGHAQVDQELRRLFLRLTVDDDGLADAVDAVDAAAGERFGDLVGRRFEGLRLVAGPDGADGLAVDAGMDAVGYGFDFGKLGHAFCQYRRRIYLALLYSQTLGRSVVRLYLWPYEEDNIFLRHSRSLCDVCFLESEPCPNQKGGSPIAAGGKPDRP